MLNLNFQGLFLGSYYSFCTKKSSNILCIFMNQMYIWWMKKVLHSLKGVFFIKKTCYWFKVAQYLSEHDIAHNVFITRGSPLDDHNDLINYSAIKIFIWARHSIFGNKHPTDFCMAVCELGRHHLQSHFLFLHQTYYPARIFWNFFKKIKESKIEDIILIIKSDILYW